MGYQTLTVNTAYKIMACNFQNVDGGELPINQAFPYVDSMTQGHDMSTGDNLQIMNDDGSYTIYYMANGKNAFGWPAGEAGKWAKDGTTEPTTDTIASGKAFWYISQGHIKDTKKAPFNIQIAGQVMSLSVPSRNLTAPFMIIGSPYPVDIPINGGIVVTGATEGYDMGTGDNLQIMNNDGSYTIYYMANGKNAFGWPAGEAGKWAKDGTTEPTTDKFPAGAAAWYIRKGTDPVTVQFVNPIAQ